MSKMQDSFLGKVSKGIKKRIFDDEPETMQDSLLIERLQSLAGAESSGQSKNPMKHSPEKVVTSNPQYKSASAAASMTIHHGDAAYQAVEPAAETSALLDSPPDSFDVEDSPIAENRETILTTGPMATILVVEDEIVTQRLTRKILEERGYEVVVAADGVEALMTLGKINFDLILCDINMPNMDGFKLMEFLNQKEIFIPVVFITVREDVEDETRGLALGAKDYIRKPINRDLLLLRIRKALDK
jgi:CheY-like chemotaxis protein